MSIATQTAHPTLNDVYSWLTSLRPRGIQLGLERVEAALARLGNPHHGLRAISVAGTNGKGSTAAFVAAMAHAAGSRVGLYQSPHLVDVTERIQVSGMSIQASDFARWAARVQRAIEPSGRDSAIPLTFFEALTVMALGYFAEREVDVCVLEVGLGGRLDATSVVDAVVGIVTPISLDHTRELGDTLAAICVEKAGILKPGTTLVTNADPLLFRDVLGPRAFELRCPIRRAGVDFLHQWLPSGFRYRGWLHRVGPVRLGLRGVHQGDNAALACAAIEALGAHGLGVKAHHMAEGLIRARHPGRLERRPPLLAVDGNDWPAMLIDGAHNPMGATVLARHLAAFLPERPRVLLFGINPDKDIDGMLAALAPTVDCIVLTTTAARPIDNPDQALAIAQRHHGRVTLITDPRDALETARRFAGHAGGLVVAGSLFLVGELYPTIPKRELDLADI